MLESAVKFSRMCVLGTLLGGTLQISAEPGKLAPSKSRVACEKLLIWAGITKPQVRATIHRQGPEVLFEKGYQVRVKAPGVSEPIKYRRTDRDLRQLAVEGYYVSRVLGLEYYRGKRVLDLACGDGSLVEQFRREGIDAIGLDIFLDRYQKSKPYFVQASVENTGLADQSVDVILATQGPITYLDGIVPNIPADVPYVRQILKEAHRVLRKGGTLLVSPIDIIVQRTAKELEDENIDPAHLLRGTVYADLPKGLRIKSAPDMQWIFLSAPESDFVRNDGGAMMARYWLEIERTD